jgi:hypothetical protein
LRQLESIVDNILGIEESNTNQKKAEKEMLRLSKPNVWNVHMKDQNGSNAELEHEVGFEAFMFVVSEHTKEDVNNMTVFRFYSLLDYIKSKTQNG